MKLISLGLWCCGAASEVRPTCQGCRGTACLEYCLKGKELDCILMEIEEVWPALPAWIRSCGFYASSLVVDFITQQLQTGISLDVNCVFALLPHDRAASPCNV